MSAEHPRVRLVVLNWNGGERVLHCLRSLDAVRWPDGALEVVVVDNASTDGSDRAIEAHHPHVRLIRNHANTGFSANNLALSDLEGVDAVGLVNPDATVAPDHLEHLVPALLADPTLGAVCPKMLLDEQVVPVDVRVTAAAGGQVHASLVRVSVDGDEIALGRLLATPQLARVDGGLLLPSAAWLPIPVPHPGAAVVVHLRADGHGEVELRTEGGATRAVLAPARDVSVAVAAAPVRRLVNNVGGELYTLGYAGDRGLGDVDRGQYDEPEEVFSWSGGAVLLRPEYLADVGLFDEDLFLYYEDLLLSWRGRLRGWRYLYVPDAVVEHGHATSTGIGSDDFIRNVERNRLVVVALCAPAGFVVRSLARFVAATLSYAVSDLVVPVLRGRRPRARNVRLRVHALLSMGRMAPRIPAKRRAVRGGRSRPDAEVLRWVRPLPSARGVRDG